MKLRLRGKQSKKVYGITMKLAARVLFSLLIGLALTWLGVPAAFADGHTFDLSGPRVDMSVTRGGKTMPISKVTDLLPGDQLWTASI